MFYWGILIGVFIGVFMGILIIGILSMGRSDHGKTHQASVQSEELDQARFN